MDERLNGGRLTHTYQHMFEDGIHARPPQASDIRGPSTSEFDLKEVVPPPRPSDTPVIQIPIHRVSILKRPRDEIECTSGKCL
jgi:hypothetical protein